MVVPEELAVSLHMSLVLPAPTSTIHIDHQGRPEASGGYDIFLDIDPFLSAVANV